MNDEPPDLDVSWRHDGFDVEVVPYVAGPSRPDLPRTFGILIAGLFLVPIALLFGAVAGLLWLLVYLTILTASTVYGRVERRRARLRRITRLRFSMHHNAVVWLWTRNGVQVGSERLPLDAVSGIVTRDAGLMEPEVAVTWHSPQGLDEVVIPMHNHSKRAADWVRQAIEARVEEVRQRIGDGEAEVPDELRAMLRD